MIPRRIYRAVFLTVIISIVCIPFFWIYYKYCIKNEDKKKKKGYDNRMINSTILVMISSQCDVSIKERDEFIMDLIKKSVNPYRVKIACISFDNEKDHDNVFFYHIDFDKYQGLSHTRRLMEEVFYKDEDIILFIDPIFDIIDKWDAILVNEMNIAKSKYPAFVMTTFPSESVTLSKQQKGYAYQLNPHDIIYVKPPYRPHFSKWSSIIPSYDLKESPIISTFCDPLKCNILYNHFIAYFPKDMVKKDYPLLDQYDTNKITHTMKFHDSKDKGLLKELPSMYEFYYSVLILLQDDIYILQPQFSIISHKNNHTNNNNIYGNVIYDIKENGSWKQLFESLLLFGINDKNRHIYTERYKKIRKMIEEKSGIDFYQKRVV